MSLAIPDDFNERCRALNARINAGEAMTYEYMAEQLGIPFEVFAAALALEIVAQDPRCAVAVDASHTPKAN